MIGILNFPNGSIFSVKSQVFYASKIGRYISSNIVFSHFQMQMVTRNPPGVSDITNDLTRLHLLAGGDANRRTVGVQRFQPAAVVDLDVVAVAAAPTVEAVGNGNSSVRGSKNRRAFVVGNVGAGVGTDLTSDWVNAVAKLRGNRIRNGEQPLQCTSLVLQ